jgi:hypothetical protein
MVTKTCLIFIDIYKNSKQKEVKVMKILFGTVEEMFVELKEKKITEARIEPVIQRKIVGKKTKIPYYSHQIKITALIEGIPAEVLVEYHAYLHGTNELMSKERAEAINKMKEIIAEISELAKACSITLKSGFYAETGECLIGQVKTKNFH